MADTKITDYDANTDPQLTDVMEIVDDPGGTPANEKVTVQNLLKVAPKIVWRDDPSAYDKAVGGLTTDGTWYDWDISSVTPAGTIGVIIGGVIEDDAAGNGIWFRENGNSNAIAAPGIRAQVAAVPIDIPFIIVPCDSSRIIEYMASNTTFTTINLVILGWIVDTVN